MEPAMDVAIISRVEIVRGLPGTIYPEQLDAELNMLIKNEWETIIPAIT